MGQIPSFNADGLLPGSDYTLTIDELLASQLVLGWRDGSDWDAEWRRTLVQNLSVLVGHLRGVGIHEIFVDGSFVEDKPHPNDIDGYFLCTPDALYGGVLEASLQEYDPVWAWDPAARYLSHGSSKRQLPMWHKYRVELFPHVGQFTGIVDAFGNQLTFPSAFRLSRNFKPKGIIKLGGIP